MKKVITICALVLMASVFHYEFAQAQQDKDLVGQEAPDFNLKNVDGRMIKLDDFRRNKGVIVVFTCNHCPYSKLYEDRINALNETYEAKGFPVVAINPNDAKAYPEDSYENMKVRSTEKAFTFPYLHDESQEVAHAYGATRTPHTYLLEFDEDKDAFIVRYVGAIDDSPKDAAAAEEIFIEDAIQNVMDGKAVGQTYTKAIGCSIKWKES